VSTCKENNRITGEIGFVVSGEPEGVEGLVKNVGAGALPAVLYVRAIFAAKAGTLVAARQHLVAPDRAWQSVARHGARHVALALFVFQPGFLAYGGDGGE